MDNHEDYNEEERDEEQQRGSSLNLGNFTKRSGEQATTAATTGEAAAGTATTGAATAEATATGTAAAGTTAAGATATGAATAGGAGAAGSAAAGTVAGTPVGWIILAVIAVIVIILVVVAVLNNVESSESIFHGIDEEELATNPEYTNLSYQELSEKLENTDYCNGAKPLEKLLAWLEDSTDKIDSLCEGIRAIKYTMKYYEDRYTGLELSPGLLLSTLVYSYASGEIKNKAGEIVDDSSPMQLLKDIFENNYITKSEIKDLVEYMIFNEKYNYYKWDIDDSLTKKVYDADGKVIHTTYFWGCIKTDYEAHYMSYNKYFIHLRYGVDSTTDFDYAGKTTIKNLLSESSKVTYAENGYEWEQNQIYKWAKTPDWCKKTDVDTPKLTTTSKIKNVLAKNFRKKSVEEYKKYDKTNEEIIDRYFQAANYEDLVNKDELLPVYSSTKIDEKGKVISSGRYYDLDYRNGFIYKKFVSFSKSDNYDEKYTPKDVELSISRIDDHEETFNEILGYGEDPIESIGGQGGASIAQIALDMYFNRHDIYGNNNLCYYSPDDYYRKNTYNGTKIDGNFHTDCNGFVALVLRAALGIGPSTATNGGSATFFGPGEYSGQWGPRSSYVNDFVLVKSNLTTLEAYELMLSGELMPGDIIGFNGGSTTHIAIYVGEGKIVDNTGSTDSCGNGNSIKYRSFTESQHYNDGSKIIIWRYKGAGSTSYNGTNPSNYSFGKANVSACSLNNYQIRLINCANENYSQQYDFNKTMPGGFSTIELNGSIRYISKETISIERYIKGLITSEMSSSYELEAIKMQMIMAKTYLFYNTVVGRRVGVDTSSNELLVQTGECFQVYHNYKYNSGYLNSRNKSKVDQAYSSVGGILITNTSGNLIEAQYGNHLQNALNDAAKKGATYIDMFENILSTYSKSGVYIYKGSILGQC